MNIKIGTRGSRLALLQAESVRDSLQALYPEDTIEIEIIHTRGDIDLKSPLSAMPGKGIFTEEIEAALLSGRIQLAVHSMKDMPADFPAGLGFTAVPKREDNRDCLVGPEKVNDIHDLNTAFVGTGSVRRQAFLRHICPGVKLESVRGNIETRMKKREENHMDYVLLACAGLIRGGYEDRIAYRFSYDELTPAPCQGILCIEHRLDDAVICEKLSALNDPTAQKQARLERAFQQAAGGGCHAPIGAVAVPGENGWLMKAALGDHEGQVYKQEWHLAMDAEPETVAALTAAWKEELGLD